MKTYPINVSQEILFLTYSVMIIEITSVPLKRDDIYLIYL